LWYFHRVVDEDFFHWTIFTTYEPYLALGGLELSGQVFDQMLVGQAVRRRRSNTNLEPVIGNVVNAIIIGPGLNYTSKPKIAIAPLVAAAIRLR